MRSWYAHRVPCQAPDKMTEPTGRTGTKLAKSGGKGASSFGTQYVMPIALDILRRDPLMEAEHFPGDLLRVSMSTGNEYWSRHSNERELLRGIALRTMKKQLKENRDKKNG